MNYAQTFVILVASFGIIALASEKIGRFFAWLRLPLISGFLFSGIVAGPYVLGLLPEGADLTLRFIDEVSLAFIAFAAGSELYLQELMGRLRTIAWITTGLVLSTFTLGTLVVYGLTNFIPFTRNLPVSARIAFALLIGAILVARSPSAAIAIINELRAKGPFTQTVLGVTVIMDVVVIILFAINSSTANALLGGLHFDLSFILLLVVEILMAVGLGYLIAQVLKLIISRPLPNGLKTVLILLTGYGIFVTSDLIRHFSHDWLHLELLVEPLLAGMVGSFLVINFSRYRSEFLKILHDSGLPIYVAFFTLTGASLELDVLTQTWPIALALFGTRLIGIFIGSFAGGMIAREPMRHNRIRWLAFVTQAGVALGLAKEVAVEFPQFGDSFATLIISLVVLNELIGPILFKFTINYVGEAHRRAETAEFDGVRDALIFGLNGQALALAQQLRRHGWQVKIAAKEAAHENDWHNTEIEVQSIEDLSLAAFQQLQADRADAVVALLSDEENYTICELAYEHFGTANLVVSLRDHQNFERFQQLGALTVDRTTAMVNLLDHLVRSPSAASLFLGMDAGQSILEFEVRNAELHGLALRELRLPLDALILSIRRQGRSLISHGYTRLRRGDRVTVVSSNESLDELSLLFET